MAITGDQILAAVAAQNSGQQVQGVDRALAGIMNTPDFAAMGVSREEYYRLDDKSKADLIANTINQKSGLVEETPATDTEGTVEAPVSPSQKSVTEEVQTPYRAQQNLSESVTEPSSAIAGTTTDSYFTNDTPYTPNQEYILNAIGSSSFSREPIEMNIKSDNMTKAAIMDSYSKDRPLSESLIEMYSQGMDAESRRTLEEASYTKISTDIGDYRSVAERSISELPAESAVDTLEAYQELVDKKMSEDSAYFTNFFDAFADPNVEEEVRQQAIGAAAVYDVYQRTMKDMVFWDQAYEIGRSLVPFVDSIDAIQFADGFNPASFAENFYNNFQELNTEDKLAVLPIIQERLLDIMPKGKAASVIQSLASPTGEQDIGNVINFWENLGFDAIDAASIFMSVGALALAGARGIKSARAAGKIDEAADVTARAAAANAADEVASKGKPIPGTAISTDRWTPAYADIRGELGDQPRLQSGVTIEGEFRRVDEDTARDALGRVSYTPYTSKAAEAVGMDTQSLGKTISPFSHEYMDAEALDGLSNATISRLKDYESRLTYQAEGIVSGDSFLRESFITDEQMRFAMGNIAAKWRKNPEVEDVITERVGDTNTVRIKYTIRDSNGNKVQTEAYDDLTLDDVQVMLFKDPGAVKRHVAGATAWSSGDLETLVQSFIRAESGNATVLNQLRQLQQEAYSSILGRGFTGFFKSLSPKQRAKINRVDDILLTGDQNQEVYTVLDLKSGKLGHVLDDDEIEAYYKIRALADNLFYIRNATKRRELDIQGYKAIRVKRGNTTNGVEIGKPLSDASAASNSINRSNSNFFFDDSTGTNRRFSEIDLSKEYANGKTLLRLQTERSFAGDANEVRYILTDANDVKELPDMVLHYRQGYIPKINTEAAYFVKEFRPRVVDGKRIWATEGGASVKTVRMFSNRKEAEAWAEQQNLAARAAGQDAQHVRYEALEDRQLEIERTIGGVDTPGNSSGQGLFTGPRSSEDIPFGPEGLAPERANSFESISRALTSTSKYATMNELRLGAQESALKTANMLRARNNPTSPAFNSFEELGNVRGQTREDRKIRAMYTYIQDAMGFPTAEEQLYKATVQNIIDNSGLARKLPGFEKSLFYLKAKDPIAAARAAAFHGLLGWFNPVQLWVQAQGAAVALSMNITRPDRMAAVLRNQFALQALQHVNPSQANIKHVAKALGMNEKELATMQEAWIRTGLKDAILTTADHAAAEQGFGVTLGAFRRSADAGLFFYRAGELFNRRLSFTTAYDEWRRANKTANLTNEDLRSILTRTNDLMLNMNRANRSNWQKGILSVPTQFASINARTIEAMLGANGNFSWIERGKILAGQAALYGAAGIPLGNLGVHYIMDGLGYTQEDIEKNFSSAEIKGINEGFLGWLTMQIFGGADLDVGDRSSLIGGLQSFTSDLIFAEGTISEKIFGAFGNVGGNFWPALLGEYEPISLGLAEGRVINVATALANPLLSSISTFRNADKAYFMHNFHKIIDNSGQTVIGPRDFTLGEELGQAFGFRLKDEVTTYDLKERNKAAQAYRKTITDQLARLYHQYALKSMHGQLTDEDKATYREAVTVLYRTVGNPYEQRLVREALQSRLTNGKDALSREWMEYRRVQGDGEVNGLFDYTRALRTFSEQSRSALSGGGLLQEGGFEGQEIYGDGE